MLETLPVLPVALRIKASVEPLCNLASVFSSSSDHTPKLLARDALATWQSCVFLGFTKPASILEACLLLLLSGSLFFWLLSCLAFSHPLGFCSRVMPLKKKSLCKEVLLSCDRAQHLFFFHRTYHGLFFFFFFASLLSVSSLEHGKGKDWVCFTYFSIPSIFQRAWRQELIQKARVGWMDGKDRFSGILEQSPSPAAWGHWNQTVISSRRSDSVSPPAKMRDGTPVFTAAFCTMARRWRLPGEHQQMDGGRKAVHPCDGVVVSLKKEGNADTCYHLDEP